MTHCGPEPCIFNVVSELSFGLRMIIVGISVVIVEFAALYRYREQLKGKPAYVYIGLVIIILLTGIFTAFFFTPVFFTPQPHGSSGPTAGVGVTIDQKPGAAAYITMIDNGDLDSWGLVGPDRTRSTMAYFDPGTTITLRSNDEVINYLNSPENSITVLTMSGTKTVENVGELPSEYQKAPDGLIDPDADIGNYANASVATAACLVRHDGVKVGERHVPANVTLPCNTPVLAQNDSVASGTSVKPTSGPNAGKTLTSPITYREDEEYTVIGTADGSERAILDFTIEGK